MSIMISIDYPAISAKAGNEIKGKLQEQDILADFGPGQTLFQNLFGKKAPDMTWCNIVAPEWFENNYDGSSPVVPLNEMGKNNLNTTVQAIYDVASGPITVLCHKYKENAKSQKELNIEEFNNMLQNEGLPYRTLIVLDRRLATRED